MQLVGELSQIVDRAESRIDRAIVADRVAAVVVAGSYREQRHQVQIGQAEFLEVADVLAQLAEILAEQIDVECTADHLLGLEPFGFVDAVPIQARTARRSDAAHAGAAVDENLLQVIEEIVPRSVQLKQHGETVAASAPASRCSNSWRFGVGSIRLARQMLGKSRAQVA